MIHFKRKGDNKASCWIEIWNKEDWDVVAEADLILMGESILIDNIITYPWFRRKGYARQIVEHLKTLAPDVKPIGILGRPDALAFWAAMGMDDGLGEEREA